jgi:hypothetical protein
MLVTANNDDNLKCCNCPWKRCTKGLKDNISLTWDLWPEQGKLNTQ